MEHRRSAQRLLRRGAALLLPIALGGCFTMGLWGFLPEEDRDPFTGREETSFAYDEDTEWSWGKFALRVLGTPFALALDCVTAPVQAVLLGIGDDDDPPARGLDRDR